MWLRPVSYTHLDVYKRQALQLGNGEKKAMLRYQNKYRGLMRANPGYLQNVLRELQAEGRVASGVTLAAKRRKRPSVEPVSYTHLDVYKRQDEA